MPLSGLNLEHATLTHSMGRPALMGMLDRFEMMFDVVTPGEGRP